jgi:hypothetical protein
MKYLINWIIYIFRLKSIVIRKLENKELFIYNHKNSKKWPCGCKSNAIATLSADATFQFQVPKLPNNKSPII